MKCAGECCRLLYAELARQQGISCDVRLDLPEKLFVDELSLAMTVSNLMENAMAAAFALPTEKRELRFAAVCPDQLILKPINPYEDEATRDEKGLPVFAKEGHGTGSQAQPIS